MGVDIDGHAGELAVLRALMGLDALAPRARGVMRNAEIQWRHYDGARSENLNEINRDEVSPTPAHFVERAHGELGRLTTAGVPFGHGRVRRRRARRTASGRPRRRGHARRDAARAVRPGVSTAELDQVAGRIFTRAGARSGPQLDYDFPGYTCISVDDEIVHGIPGPRRLRDGDLVKLDVTAKLDGFYADACVSVPVGRPRRDAVRLAGVARAALTQAIGVATAGAPLNRIGATVERVADRAGAAVCEDLLGHGIGRSIHEDPPVPNLYVAELDKALVEGLVLTIEPMLSAGSGEVAEAGDGWTIRTADGALSAHAEHTLVITRGAPIVLTR